MISDLVFDVGMHRGEDTAYYLAKGHRVVGFEANPALAQHCRKRFETEVADERLTIVEGAISDKGSGTETFYLSPNSVWGTTDEAWVERNAWLGEVEAVEVARVDIRTSIDGFGVPAFAKIDIEGADRICLEGLGACSSRPWSVSIESEKADWDALVAEFDLLEDLGYRRFSVVQQAGIGGRVINTRTLDGSSLAFRFEEHASGPFGDDLTEWAPRQEALDRYRRIFRRYRLLGDRALIRRSRIGRALRGRLDQLSPWPLPGWYDTHARLD